MMRLKSCILGTIFILFRICDFVFRKSAFFKNTFEILFAFRKEIATKVPKIQSVLSLFFYWNPHEFKKKVTRRGLEPPNTLISRLSSV